MKRVLLLLAVAVAALSGGVARSQATFVGSSSNPTTSFVTSPVFNGVSVSLTDPGTPLRGAVALAATAASDRALTSVTFQRSPAGASIWTTICAPTAVPYGCSWDTTGVSDGLYDLQAVALDASGYSRTSSVGSRRVDNTAPTIALTDPGAAFTTGATLQSTSGDGGGSGVASVTYQYRANGSTGAWSTACTGSSSPFSCTFAPLPADGLYDLRAVATDAAGLATTSAVIASRRVDTAIPSSSVLTNPGSPLRGTITLSGTAADGASGMASMRFEYKLSAGSTWSTACTDVTPPSPFSCGWDTTTVADGSYDLRAVAIDAAGNVRTSTAVTARLIDNTAPVVSVTAPGTFRTSTTVNATATDASGVTSVAIQYRTAGTGGYTTLCTDTSSPYSCAWSAGALADGAYDVRAVAVDTLGNQSTSAVVSAYVNNTGPTGTDVQGTNGGVNDVLDTGDTVVFSYSTAMMPSSILAGWNGTSAPMKVRVNNGGTSDTMEFYDSANSTPLGLLAPGTALQIKIDHVLAPTVFNATISMSGANITVTIGTLVSGTVNVNPKGKNDMVWQTNSQALSAAGKPTLPATVTESGANDLDF